MIKAAKQVLARLGDKFVDFLPFLAVIFWVAYALEPSPLWYPNEPFPISEEALVAGDEFTFEIQRCADRSTNYIWTQEFLNTDTDERMAVPGSLATAPKGCSTIKSVIKTIPEQLPAGNYRLIFKITAEGILKDHHFVVRTAGFKVINK